MAAGAAALEDEVVVAFADMAGGRGVDVGVALGAYAADQMRLSPSVQA